MHVHDVLNPFGGRSGALERARIEAAWSDPLRIGSETEHLSMRGAQALAFA